MRFLPIRTVSFFAASAVVAGMLAAYPLSGTYSAAQTLSPQGVITPRTRALIDGENAYVLGTPEIVSDIPEPDNIRVSHDLSAVLIAGVKARPYRDVTYSDEEAKARRADRLPQMHLDYWDTRTRTTKTLLREAPDSAGNLPTLEDIQWFPQTHIALVTVVRIVSPDTAVRTLMRVNGATGAVTRITELTPNQEVSVSPYEQLAIIVTISHRRKDTPPDILPTLRIYTPQGIGKGISLPEGTDEVDWMPDGKSVWTVRYFEEIIDGKRKSRDEFSLVDLKTGVVTPQVKESDIRDAPRGSHEAPESPLEWEDETVTQIDASGKKQKTPSVWLHIAEPVLSAKKSTDTSLLTPTNPLAADRLLVATNAHPEGMMAGSNINAVLFTQEGLVYASPVFRMNTAEYDQRMRAVQRAAAMKNARIIGTGIMMYTQDYDENYPLSGPGVPDRVGPYVMNPSVFDNPFSGDPGFVYSYRGETNITKIATPSTTQLGYLPGFGGKALLWGDGHVTWQPDDNAAKP